MKKVFIGLVTTVLLFAVVAFWSLQTELTTSPLLTIPTPADDATAAAESKDASGQDDFRPHPFDAAVDETATTQPADSRQITVDRLEQVRQLIRQLRPQQSETAIEVWANEFGHMNNADISFLLTQSGMLGELSNLSANALVDAAEFNDGDEPEGPSQTPSTTSIGIRISDRRIDTAQTNLNNSMTIGYRDLLEFSVLSAGQIPDARRVPLRRLTPGQAFETKDPLHLALRTPGLVFFQLADGRLTRNGMFGRMDDGRLGLRAGDGFVALRDSPVLPVEFVCKIMADGRVFLRDITDPIGSIRVVTVGRANPLLSDDGVYFRTTEKVNPAEQFELQAGAVELSNVDVDQNRQLLNALRRR